MATNQKDQKGQGQKSKLSSTDEQKDLSAKGGRTPQQNKLDDESIDTRESAKKGQGSQKSSPSSSMGSSGSNQSQGRVRDEEVEEEDDESSASQRGKSSSEKRR